MTPERAIEILDPTHREHYDSIKPINEAMRMGQAAIERCMIAKKPYILESDDGGCDEYLCSFCGLWVIHSDDYCPHCGQLIDWSE